MHDRGSATLDTRAFASRPSVMANEGEGNDASYHTSFPSMTTAAGPGTTAGGRVSFSCLPSDLFR